MAYIRFIRSSSFFGYGSRPATQNGFIRAALTLAAFISVVFFPWPLTAIFALAASAFEPLVPLAVGLFADALYLTPYAGALPLATLCGALATALAFFVRSRLSPGIIGG